MGRVVVVGAGYAGLAALRVLAAQLPTGWTVTLVEPRSRHELLTRLPEVVAGRLNPDHASIPFGAILPERVTHVQTAATGLDSDRHTLATASGDLPYDRLVLAAGVKPVIEPALSGTGGIYPVRSVVQALALRDAVRTIVDARPRARIVLVGAGYTAAEVAGELLAAKEPAHRPQVDIVADLPRMLPNGNPRLAAVAERVLRGRGARLYLGEIPQDVNAGGVRLANGHAFAADIVVWGGASGPDRYWSTGDPSRIGGRIAVNTYLETDRKDVFAAGDIALIPGVPSNAQLAIEEGRLAAINTVRSLRAAPLREFRPRSIGEALSLGPTDGVAEVFGFVVTGRRALAVKSAALTRYLVSIGGVSLAARYAGDTGRG